MIGKRDMGCLGWHMLNPANGKLNSGINFKQSVKEKTLVSWIIVRNFDDSLENDSVRMTIKS